MYQLRSRECPRCKEDTTKTHCGKSPCGWRVCYACSDSIEILIFDATGRMFFSKNGVK